MEAKKIRDSPKGEYFTLHPVEEPKETQVYIRDEYDRSEGRYWAYKWSDVCYGRFFSGDKIVYIGFTF